MPWNGQKHRRSGHLATHFTLLHLPKVNSVGIFGQDAVDVAQKVIYIVQLLFSSMHGVPFVSLKIAHSYICTTRLYDL